MATSFGGFIASALGGAAGGYAEGAQMEMKKQAELDLKKQMLEAETEKALRIDDIMRQRTVTYERANTAYNQNPDTIAAAVKADVDKVKALVNSGLSEEKAKLFVQEERAKLKNQTALLPDQREAALLSAQSTETSQADLRPIAEREAIAASASKDRVTTATAGSTAAAASAVTLAGAQAEAKVASQLVEAFTQKYNASKDFEKLKAKDLTEAKAAELKALVADTEYMKALKTQNSVLHAHLVEIANINATKDIKVAEIRGEFFDARTDAQLNAAELKIEEARRKRLADANKPAKAPGTPNVGLELERAEKSAKEALARVLGVEAKEANGAYAALKRKADGGDKAAKAKLAEVTPMKNRLEAASAEWDARKKDTSAAPAAAASGGPVEAGTLTKPNAGAVAAPAAAASKLPPLKPGMFETKK